MTDLPDRTLAKIPSAAACAEAAAWIARLHSENRTAKIEAGFKRWLATSLEHQTAFELANEIWTGTEGLPKPAVPAFVQWPKTGLVLTWPRALIAAAVITFVAIGLDLYFRDSALATGVGEQRNLTLEDGTRVSLNTASRIHVRYDRTARRVELDQGEAFFEVAKRPDWPFIVVAGGEQVVARGTAFLVRRDEDRVAVTLMEGKVVVAPAEKPVTRGPPVTQGIAVTESGHSLQAPQGDKVGPDVTLAPGQRLTLVSHEAPKLDRPSLDRVTAWQRGELILDHTPLADAVAEMNRYSETQLTIDTPEAGRAQVTGIFRVGDSENFAQAVGETYHLQITARDRQILLSGLPRRSAAH